MALVAERVSDLAKACADRALYAIDRRLGLRRGGLGASLGELCQFGTARPFSHRSFVARFTELG